MYIADYEASLKSEFDQDQSQIGAPKNTCGSSEAPTVKLNHDHL